MSFVLIDAAELLTLDEACSAFGLDGAALGRLIDDGQVGVTRVDDRVRVSADDLRRTLARP